MKQKVTCERKVPEKKKETKESEREKERFPNRRPNRITSIRIDPKITVFPRTCV